MGHNGGKKFIDVFHVSDHLEQFGRLLFFFIFWCGKINYLDGWGVPPMEISAKIINVFFNPFPKNIIPKQFTKQNRI